MSKEYQIEKAQAEEEFTHWVKENGQPVQLTFATADVVRLAQQGLGELLRQVGRQFIEVVMEAEVEKLVGIRSAQLDERSAYRWGSEKGYCVIDGQRVPLHRPRVRSRDHHELALGSYELFQRTSLVSETVWQKIMHGLSMRHLQRSGAAVRRSLWAGEEHHQRALHRSQPAQVAAVDDALDRASANLYVAGGRDLLQR